MATDYSIIQDFDCRYEEAYSAWNEFYPLAERDLRFFLGDQWDEKERRQLLEEGRSSFAVNRARRQIHLVEGYQRKNRLSSVVAPIEESDQQVADQLSELLLYVMNYGNGYQTISDCFSGALKTGWNLMSVWMDYRDDPVNGDICFGREPYNSFITDPYFTETDFSDCAYILRRKYLGLDQTISLLPERAKDIKDLYHLGWDRDDKFTWLPYQRQPNGETLLAFNEMYEQKWRDVPVLVDMETGEKIEFDVQDEVIGEFLRLYPQLRVIKQAKRYIKKSVIVNDELLAEEENPYGLDEYPFCPFMAIFEPESDQWGLKVQSLMRTMIDSQRLANRRRSQLTDLVESQINSGYIAKENTIVNPRSLFQSSQGKVIWKHEDAPPDALEKIQPAQIPQGFFQLQELSDRDIMDVVGISDASFGESEYAGESGVMMMLRQGAQIVNLQYLFDNLRFSQKAISQKVVKLIQTWSPMKIQRVLNQEPDPKLFEMDLSKYDLVVQEGVLTDTQRQMYFRQLVDLKQLGAPVTGEMLAKAAPIQGKSTYTKELAELEKQQAQAQAQQAEMQQHFIHTQSQASQAKALSDVALSKERFTRSLANLGLEEERNSEAVQNRAQAALDRAKAIKELEAMDDDRFLKFLQIVRLMEDENKAEEHEAKSEDIGIVEISERLNSAFPEQQQQQQAENQARQQMQEMQQIQQSAPQEVANEGL